MCRILNSPDIRPFEKKEGFVQQQVIKVLPVFRKTGTGYENIFGKCHQEYFSREKFSLPTDLA